MNRLYMDWNATAPLRAEARAAMIAAMDVVGNPSSVHAEGRAAKSLMERARAQVLDALGAHGQDLIFTSGATEAAGLLLADRELHCANVEHDAVKAWCQSDLVVDGHGRVTVSDPARSTLQIANSETGVIQSLPAGLAVADLTQGFGKIPLAFNWTDAISGFVSSHKIGGPKGVGAVVIRQGTELAARIKGGGQEMGFRAGTENLIGIVGFGAAAQAASRDLADGVWEKVAEIRNILKTCLAAGDETLYFPSIDVPPGRASVGRDTPDMLPNTLSVIAPDWKGETQVMRMDLLGYAVSAGSACSSGKVRASQVLTAMGWNDEMAGCALRVSIGPGIEENEVLRFAELWLNALKKHRARH